MFYNADFRENIQANTSSVSLRQTFHLRTLQNENINLWYQCSPIA